MFSESDDEFEEDWRNVWGKHDPMSTPLLELAAAVQLPTAPACASDIQRHMNALNIPWLFMNVSNEENPTFKLSAPLSSPIAPTKTAVDTATHTLARWAADRYIDRYQSPRIATVFFVRLTTATSHAVVWLVDYSRPAGCRGMYFDPHGDSVTLYPSLYTRWSVLLMRHLGIQSREVVSNIVNLQAGPVGVPKKALHTSTYKTACGCMWGFARGLSFEDVM